MAYWNSKTRRVERIPAQELEGYPSWQIIDCGCCGGIQWSAGYDPVVCHDCMGSGVLCHHLPSGLLALYPGGTIRGRMKPEEVIS